MLAADPIAFGLASRAGRSTVRLAAARPPGSSAVAPATARRCPRASTAHRRGPDAAAASKRLWTWIYRHLSDR
jgi:hypothetical protein